MEIETIIMIIAMGLLALFQFLLMVIVGLVGFIFRSSINYLKSSVTEALNTLNSTVREIKEDRVTEKADRTRENEAIYARLRAVEKDYADREEVSKMISKSK